MNRSRWFASDFRVDRPHNWVAILLPEFQQKTWDIEEQEIWACIPSGYGSIRDDEDAVEQTRKDTDTGRAEGEYAHGASGAGAGDPSIFGGWQPPYYAG